jgi:hypothetical protein
MDGWELLAGINGDARRRTIAVVILTTFEAEAETDRGYDLQARGCLRKLGKWEGFADLMKNTADFRRAKVKLSQLKQRDESPYPTAMSKLVR